MEELRKRVDIVRELGEDWRKNVDLLNEVSRRDRTTLESIKRLCKESGQGDLVKIGLTLIAFPFPIVIDDVLGWSFLTAGLIQRRIKNSALYLEDVDKAFPRLFKELQEIRHEIV